MFISNAHAQIDFITEKAANGDAEPLVVLLTVVVAIVCLASIAITVYVIIKKFRDSDKTGEDIHAIRNSLQKLEGKLEFSVQTNSKDIKGIDKRVEGLESEIRSPQGLQHRMSRLEGKLFYKEPGINPHN